MLETFCFELAREMKPDNFELVDLQSQVDGFKVAFRCRFDNRIYLVDIRPASNLETQFILKKGVESESISD